MYDYDTEYTDMIVEKGLYVDPTLALGRLNSLRFVAVSGQADGAWETRRADSRS